MRRKIATIATAAAILTLTACGGSGGSTETVATDCQPMSAMDIGRFQDIVDDYSTGVTVTSGATVAREVEGGFDQFAALNVTWPDGAETPVVFLATLGFGNMLALNSMACLLVDNVGFGCAAADGTPMANARAANWPSPDATAALNCVR